MTFTKAELNLIEPNVRCRIEALEENNEAHDRAYIRKLKPLLAKIQEAQAAPAKRKKPAAPAETPTLDALILVIGPGVWGCGHTLTEALGYAKNPKIYNAFLVHKDYEVQNGDYILNPPGTWRPFKIDSKGF